MTMNGIHITIPSHHIQYISTCKSKRINASGLWNLECQARETMRHFKFYKAFIFVQSCLLWWNVFRTYNGIFKAMKLMFCEFNDMALKFGSVSGMQFGCGWLKIDQHWVWYIEKADKKSLFRCNLLRPDFYMIEWFWSKTNNLKENVQLEMSDFCHFENSKKMQIFSWLHVQSGFLLRNQYVLLHFNGCTDYNFHQF